MSSPLSSSSSSHSRSPAPPAPELWARLVELEARVDRLYLILRDLEARRPHDPRAELVDRLELLEHADPGLGPSPGRGQRARP